MKYDVKNRFTGEVQFTADIDPLEDLPDSILLGLALLWGAENGARLSEGDYSGAYLVDVPLINQELYNANFTNANLCSAQLHYSNLFGANFTNANLCNARMVGAIIWDANFTTEYTWGAQFTEARLFNVDIEKLPSPTARVYHDPIWYYQKRYENYPRDIEYGRRVRVKDTSPLPYIEIMKTYWEERRKIKEYCLRKMDENGEQKLITTMDYIQELSERGINE